MCHFTDELELLLGQITLSSKIAVNKVQSKVVRLPVQSVNFTNLK